MIRNKIETTFLPKRKKSIEHKYPIPILSNSIELKSTFVEVNYILDIALLQNAYTYHMSQHIIH